MFRRTVSWALAVGVAACGDNIEPPLDGPPIARASELIVIAHFDDDMIFMQPELIDAIARGSLTTVYVTSGDPVYGLDREERNFNAARIAYSSVAHVSDWDCGYVLVGGSPAHHCRLPERGISLISLDVPDGGRHGEFDVGPLYLVQGDRLDVPLLGPIHGVATKDSIIEALADVLTETQPTEIHALDLASTHGDDHPSHVFSSSFLLWAAARVGYQGPVRWHRGYSVECDAPTLDDATYATVRPMLGYFEACYFGCGPCGSSCTELNMAHEVWLRRQYSSDRALSAEGRLVFEGTAPGSPALCLAPAAAAGALADCATAPSLHLDATGHLRLGDACIASRPDAADPVVLAACASDSAQYWVADTEGHVWNGTLPEPVLDMTSDHAVCLSDEIPERVPDMMFNHVRCLNAEAQAGSTVTAATCGERLHPTWQFQAR